MKDTTRKPGRRGKAERPNVKDLPARETQAVKGGQGDLESTVEKKNKTTVTDVIAKI